MPSNFALAGVFGVVGAVGCGVSGSLMVLLEDGVPGVCVFEGESSADFLLGSLVSCFFVGKYFDGGSGAGLFL